MDRGEEYHHGGRRGRGEIKQYLLICVLCDLCGFPFVPAEPLVERRYAYVVRFQDTSAKVGTYGELKDGSQEGL
ncbi:MAG: hypothetical protein WC749_14445 [Dehalococcoidia bacterium]